MSSENRSPILVLAGVVKDFPSAGSQNRVLDHVDLLIRQGCLTVIAGPSGAGKSTLLNLMGGLDRPSEGSIRLEGRELAELSDSELSLIRRRRIGFVFQMFNLLPNLRTWHNIALPLLLDAVPPDRARQSATQLGIELGIENCLDKPSRLLSGGEMQRAAIARALIRDPALVLADEPTGNLDSSNGRAVLALLQSAARERGCTVVMATHDPSALEICDHLIQLKDGRVASSDENVAK